MRCSKDLAAIQQCYQAQLKTLVLLMQIRAALLVHLLRLVNGSSAVRLPVVEALLKALNDNSLNLRKDSTDLGLNRQIADALAGMHCPFCKCRCPKAECDSIVVSDFAMMRCVQKRPGTVWGMPDMALLECGRLSSLQDGCVVPRMTYNVCIAREGWCKASGSTWHQCQRASSDRAQPELQCGHSISSHCSRQARACSRHCCGCPLL